MLQDLDVHLFLLIFFRTERKISPLPGLAGEIGEQVREIQQGCLVRLKNLVSFQKRCEPTLLLEKTQIYKPTGSIAC